MKLITIELARPLPAVPPRTCGEQWILVLLHREPLGILHTGADGCSPRELAHLILEQHGWAIARHLAADAISSTSEEAPPPSLDDLTRLADCPRRSGKPRTSVTV